MIADVTVYETKPGQSCGYRVTLVEDAIRHLDQEKGLAFLEEVRRRGGRIVAAEQLLSSSTVA